MATTIATIIADARTVLLELTARYWTDAELLSIANDGIKDLWKNVIDLYKDHIVTTDITSMSLPANTADVAGVPTDLFRVLNLEPRIVGPSSTNPGLVFKYRDLTHPDFVQARASGAISPRFAVIWYAVINAGAPVGAPTIRCAPKVTSAVNLTVEYNPVIANKASGDNNPIPGESDKALKHYIIAFARSKERPARDPDPEHLSIYATEARKINIALAGPRSIQEPDVVDSFMQDGAGAYGEW